MWYLRFTLGIRLWIAVSLCGCSSRISDGVHTPKRGSEAGIAFSPSGLTVNWKQIRKWAEEKEGVSVTLDCLPFELPETLEARVLVHENGVSCTLTPDSYLDRQALIRLFRSFDPLQEGEKQ